MAIKVFLMSTLHCMLVFSLFVGIQSGNCEQISEINRYGLSTGLLQYYNNSIYPESKKYTLYSNPNHLSNKPLAISLTTAQQIIGINFKTILGYEQFREYNRFVAFTGDVQYETSFLSAVISADVYTTESRIDDALTDVSFERFIKKDAQKPITGAMDFRFNLPEAYLEARLKFIKLTTGKMKLRWGPGYKGTLGMSGCTYSPFYFYNLNLKFGNLLQATAFLCGYDDEVFYRNELLFRDTTIVKNNKISLKTNFPRYGAGQRLDLRLGKHLQLGFYELVDFFDNNELTRFANPLQIYYLANESSGTNNANLLGGMDFNIIIKRFRIYGEFLNDDITIFQQTGNPNKYAFQLGTTFYGKGPLIQTGIEYTHVAPYVYGHYKVLSRHANWGESMGWPWGNDQDLFNIHAIFNLPYNIKARTELNYWIKGEGKIEDDWYADGKPDLDKAPYWPQNSKRYVSAMLAAEYSPFDWMAFNFYYEPVFEKDKVTHGVYSYLQVGIPGKREIKIAE